MNTRIILLFLTFLITPILGMDKVNLTAKSTQATYDAVAREVVKNINLAQALQYNGNLKDQKNTRQYLQEVHSLNVIYELQRRLAPLFDIIRRYNKELMTYFTPKTMADVMFSDENYELFEQDGDRYMRFLSGSQRGTTVKLSSEFCFMTSLEARAFFLQSKQLRRRLLPEEEDHALVESIYFAFLKNHINSPYQEVSLLAKIAYAENLRENIRGALGNIKAFNEALARLDQKAKAFLELHDKAFLQINNAIQPLISNIVDQKSNIAFDSLQPMQEVFEEFNRSVSQNASYYKLLADKLYAELTQILSNKDLKNRMDLYRSFGPAVLDRIKQEAGTKEQQEEIESKAISSPVVSATSNSTISESTQPKKKKKKKKSKSAQSASASNGALTERTSNSLVSEQGIESSVQHASAFLSREIRYDNRIMRWFNDDAFTQDKTQWSIFYHTFSRLADKFILKYGIKLQRPNATFAGNMDDAYYMGGEIRQYNQNGQIVFKKSVLFNITFGADGICYHRGFEARNYNDLFRSFERNEYEVNYPRFEQQVREAEYQIEWHHHDTGAAQAVADSYTESEYYFKIQDETNGFELVLFKLAAHS